MPTPTTMHDGQIMITQAHLVEYQMNQKLHKVHVKIGVYGPDLIWHFGT